MTEPPQEILYRRVNLLNSLMIAGWLILLLALAVVTILGYGQIRRFNDRMDRLARQMADLADEQPPGPAAPPAPSRWGSGGDGRTATGAARPGQPSRAGTGAPPTTAPGHAHLVAGATTGPEDAGTYDVSPTAGLPTVDPDRPGGLAAWFHDLRTSASPDPDNPMLLLISGPLTVRKALGEVAKVAPGDAADQKIPAADRLLAAQLFLQTADDRQAHRWASAVAAESPADGRAWLIAGLASMRLSQYPRAIRELAQSADRLPKRPEPLKALGEAYAGAGQLTQAIAIYRRAVALVPKDLEVSSRLADLLVRDRQIDAAVAQLRVILGEDANRSADRARLAKLLVIQDKAKEALAVLSATPAAAPQDVRLHLAKGHALMAVGDLPGAEAAFDRAVDVTPLSAEGWHFLGLTRLKQRKSGPAVAALERAIAIDSTNAASWEYLGVALANEGKLDEAVARLQEAVRLNVGSAQTHYILALLYVWQKQDDAALAMLRQAVKLDPSYLAKARKETVFSGRPADSPIGKFLKEGNPP